jgi:hypothetical protein
MMVLAVSLIAGTFRVSVHFQSLDFAKTMPTFSASRATEAAVSMQGKIKLLALSMSVDCVKRLAMTWLIG